MSYAIQLTDSDGRNPRLLGDFRGISPVIFPDKAYAEDFANGMNYWDWLRGYAGDPVYSVVKV